jgi:hypothetical protein
MLGPPATVKRKINKNLLYINILADQLELSRKARYSR